MKRNIILTTLLLLTFSARAAFVAFEAESGVLGADFTNGTDGAIQFISISTDTVNSSNPGNTNRMATYNVTFPAADTYQLYARVLVGPGSFNDDSMFYGNGFGVKNSTNNSDWTLVNGLAGVGFSNSTDVVTGGGTLGSGMWKWINLSQFTSQNGFAVSAGNLTQTFQIGARENGLDIDKFVFGTANDTFTVSNLDNGTDGTPPPPPVCAITWTNTQQHIDGFGFSSAWCGTLSNAKNAALFGTLGMSLLRIRIDENNNWNAESNNAAAAHAYGATVLGCAWKAPAYMTYTNVAATLTNCFLLTNSYNAYASWLNQAANFHHLDYVSVLNEPNLTSTDPTYLNMTSDQIRFFCASNAPSIGRPVAMADAFNYDDTISDPTLNDSNAVNNITYLSGHLYGGGNYVHTNALAHGKPVWMTEHYLTGGTTNFPICLSFAKEISDTMNNQFSAYIAWWAYDGDTNINLANNSGTIFKDGYTLGQFSKFIRPGYYRIGTTNATKGVQITAYKDLVSSSFVIVALNLGDTVVTQQFNLYGFPVMPISSSVTPWITSFTQSLTPQPPITNVNSSFTYSIQPSNIVTFVGTAPVAAPTNLNATAGINKVSLNWNAVAGVTGYNVMRSTVGGGPYASVASISVTSYSDVGLAAQTTYYYVVAALNGGGQSLDSPEVSVTTPLIYTNSPLADSYVDSGNPTVNFGTLTNMIVKNNVTLSTRAAYLMFDVHTLANVLSATLSLLPNRVDDPTVKMDYELASTNWNETSITWNNQPGGLGVFFATNTAAVGVPIVMDITSLVASQATNGGLFSIRITQPTNSLNGLVQFCSKECTIAGWRPTLTYTLAANTPPVLAPVNSQTIGAGMTLSITNVATDNDVPAQILTFSLPTAPTNAVLNSSNGVLTWRPLVTQANTTNPFTVMVADNGAPSLTATQNFVVTVTNLATPVISTFALNGGQLVLQVNGDSGPDYQVQASTNFTDWNILFTSNSPAMPFVWTNSNTGLPINFFRIVVGPPF